MRNQREHAGSDILEMTTEIVSSYVNGNEIRAENLSDLIRSIHKSLVPLSNDDFEKPTEKPKSLRNESQRSECVGNDRVPQRGVTALP